MHASKKKNWEYRCEEYFKLLGFIHIFNIDCSVKCEQIKIDFIFFKWLSVLKYQTGQNGNGQNKLRTYHMFKFGYEVECYIRINLPKKYKKAIAMVRAGVAPINIELLHYGSAKRPVEERKCFILFR